MTTTSRLNRHLLALLLLANTTSNAAELTVAVASNFQTTFTQLAAEYTRRHGEPVVASHGSTGKLYAQITHGAPFELFLAADELHPQRLLQAGLAVGTPLPYATGRLAIWCPRACTGPPPGLGLLHSPAAARIALANPVTAPYGQAAQAVLEHEQLWEPESGQLIFGDSIAQAHAFVATGNVGIGLVAWSQLLELPPATRGVTWPVPQELHPPLIQAAVILQPGAQLPGIRRLVEFILSPAGRAIIDHAGYGLPPPRDPAPP